MDFETKAIYFELSLARGIIFLFSNSIVLVIDVIYWRKSLSEAVYADETDRFPSSTIFVTLSASVRKSCCNSVRVSMMFDLKLLIKLRKSESSFALNSVSSFKTLAPTASAVWLVISSFLISVEIKSSSRVRLGSEPFVLLLSFVDLFSFSPSSSLILFLAVLSLVALDDFF